jgi:hypothetical protein
LGKSALPFRVGAGQRGDVERFLRGEVVSEILFYVAKEGAAVVAFGGVVEVLLRVLVGQACCDIQPDIAGRAVGAFGRARIGFK